jgi:hypothetical protein
MFSAKQETQSMMLHKFRDQTSRFSALTIDRDGANLPRELGAWVFMETVPVRHWDGERFIGDPMLIDEAVETYGFIIFPWPFKSARGTDPNA